MRTRFYLLGILLLFSPLISVAQKVVKVSGEYIYHASKTVSPFQAEKTAVERARMQALAEEFGTQMNDITTTVMQSSSHSSDVALQKISQSEVKGVWLSDEREPKVTFLGMQDGMMVYKAEVWGLARAISSSQVPIEAFIWKKDNNGRFQSLDFTDGDQLLLSFRSPSDGYLSVFLVDEAEQVFQLLPYRRSASSSYRVRGGKNYMFFSLKDAYVDTEPVDEYILQTEKSLIHQYIYIVFSPNLFYRAPMPMEGDISRPVGGLGLKDFQKWLSECRIKDVQMVVDCQVITLKGK